MEIRKATVDEIPALVDLGRAMHEESPRFSRSPFSEEKAEAVTRGIITDGNGLVLVAVCEGEIVGMLVGFVAEHFFSTAPYACDLVVYVKPEYRGTSAAVRLLTRWDNSVAPVVDESVLGISTEVQPERTRKLYERLGYELSGYTMLKRYRNV